jgi:hypothetical protein
VPLERPWPTAPPVEYFALRDDADGGESATLQPAEHRYRGRVFVLVRRTAEDLASGRDAELGAVAALRRTEAAAR